ncbi:MAG: SUF system Fe-S cluster assembly regulator [Proteobacteria bacterium]|nr:SUF system Fe-S cluster assembly regulator [Pseudomonadota bacterium]
MLKMSKLTDYGTMVLAFLAANPTRMQSASDVARDTHLALPTVSKLLKLMTRTGLVVSTRGALGGYQLARAPEEISAADVIDALEGPVAITQCSGSVGHCELEDVCGVSSSWQKINVAIRRALDEVRLPHLAAAEFRMPPMNLMGIPITQETDRR